MSVLNEVALSFVRFPPPKQTIVGNKLMGRLPASEEDANNDAGK